MPKVKFFQPRKLGHKRYPKGVCEVPAADCQGWFWDEMLKCGDLAEVSDTVAATHQGAEDKARGSAGGPPKPDASGMSEEKKSSQEPKSKR